MRQGQDLVDVKCFSRDCGKPFQTTFYSINTQKAVCPTCKRTSSVHMFHGDEPIHPREACPTCGGPALLRTRCRCDSYDIKCPGGHQWHTCRVHKVAVPGIGHGQSGCTCEGTNGQS